MEGWQVAGAWDRVPDADLPEEQHLVAVGVQTATGDRASAPSELQSLTGED